MPRPAQLAGDEPTAERVWRAMAELVRSQDRKDEACAAVGLSFFRLKALRRLATQSMTLRELAASSQVDAPYATVMVDDLAARGFVTREPHPTDRRARVVTVTALGLAAARRAEAILLTPPPAMVRLPAADLQALDRIVAAVTSDQPPS